MIEKTNLQPNIEETVNTEEAVKEEKVASKEKAAGKEKVASKEKAFGKEEALEYLVWSILLNVSKFSSISFVNLYKSLGLTSSSEVWVGPKICWACAKSPEFGKLLQKRGNKYEISEYGKKILEKLSKKYGEFTVESAYKIFEVSKIVSAKELREYAKSL